MRPALDEKPSKYHQPILPYLPGCYEIEFVALGLLFSSLACCGGAANGAENGPIARQFMFLYWFLSSKARAF